MDLYHLSSHAYKMLNRCAVATSHESFLEATLQVRLAETRLAENEAAGERGLKAGACRTYATALPATPVGG